MVRTTFQEVLAGPTGPRFGTTDTGQPARRVITTPFIGTRTRAGNTERGIGVEFIYSTGKVCIFHPMEAKNPKEYLRALDILVHMERIDPDILAACAQAGKKQSAVEDSCFRSLKKHQSLQLEKIFAKRELVFEATCNKELLKEIIAGFCNFGLPIDNPIAKVADDDFKDPWGIRPHETGIGIESLAMI